jgi:alpha-tubulin suppressor-like RCC1 family protein
MPNQFLSDEFGDIEDYFVTDYRLIDNFVGDTLWGWGSNGNGQLGDFSTTQRNIPVTTFSGGTNWKQISCGLNQTAAIKTDGSLWVWGRNEYGQLGINVYGGNRNTPVTTFAGGNNWKQVSFGREHAAAIKTDGSLWIWGYNTDRQLGINNTDARSIPVTTFAGGNNWKSVACGFFHTAAIKTDGTLWGWGRGENGQLGTNDIVNRITPTTTFTGGTTWKSVTCGWKHTAAIKTDGTLWTWGGNAYGQLGINNTDARSIPVTTFAGGNTWKQVSGAAGGQTAAIKTDGSLWVWGYNLDGRLGINNITNPIPTPVPIFAGGKNWKQVSSGDAHMAAIKTDGTLWIWGPGTSGQLGNNATTDRSTPVTTFAGGNNWKSVSAGRFTHVSNQIRS